MQKLISKCFIPHHMNVEYGIINVQMLIKFNDQLIEQFSWEELFRNLNVNEMVSLFHKNIKNILSNYIPHETITCDGKDPPWSNKNINQLIQEKNNTYKSYILSDKNPQIFERVKSLQNQLKCSIEGSQKKLLFENIQKINGSS